LREHAEANTQAGKDNPPSPTALPNADWEQIRQLLYAKDGPADIPADQAEKLFDRGMRKTIKDLRAKVDQFKATSPAAPPRAMILTDNPNPKNTRIFLRGSPGRMGDEVPRHYLQVLASSDRVPVESGSGRLELAREIASDKNPLTARVLVNRVWLHHFGTAIVKTPSDFGAQGDPPTHPQLLDYLASRFMRDGWSIKALHRLMMLTSTYQQSSEDNPRYRDKDPGNLFVWRMNRRRQDFESLRDSLMVTSGRLDKTAGGASVQILGNTPVPRRTVYGFIDRQNLPGTFRNFDFASPDTTNPQRDFTTVPQQALFMMNSPFVIEQAKELIQRIEVTILKNPADRVAALYRLVYGRAPDADELSRAVAFVEAQENTPPPPPMPVVWQYGYGKFDPATGRLASFQTLPHFTGSAWQGGAELPDPKLGWVSLTESGGHPGDASAYSAVRRWVAPNDAIVRIASKIKHPSDQGDGVIARVVTSRKGQIANWPVRNGQVDGNLDQVEVKKGDALDFIIDCNTNVSFDSFDWAPIIHVVDSKAEARGALKWDAKTEFQGPPSERPAPLDAWGQFAQVLLMSNEFVFVD
jgi:hypothetical protein